MQGTYDPTLVVLSILIAALASYVAIEFAGRIFARRDQRGRWLTAGAVAMGSGIWSMHFVGMAAFTLPIPVSYDLWITVGSWLAAVAVSGLALHLVSRGPLSAGTVTLGALAMGAGVCIMHYAGMGAMRMDPGLGYDLPWFIASVLIAVGASAAALVIVARLRTVRSWRDVGLRTAAAAVMGLAVAGMHYSGMAAVQFDPNAFCAPGNLLAGDAIATPTVLASLLGLGFALFFALSDARAVVQAKRAARAEAERLNELAFVDRETGLVNRARFGQQLVEALRRQPVSSVASIRVLDARGEEAKDRVATAAAVLAPLQSSGLVLARTSPAQLMVLAEGLSAEAVRSSLLPGWRRLAAGLAGQGVQLAFGLAEAPADGDNAQALMLRAASRSAEREDEPAPEPRLGAMAAFLAAGPAVRDSAA
ncbi:MHYT domain-containing protein [Arenimonas sp. SCN 70-307]|uniref:MHYT domain-containing protein n=1 Tax=Arenimonas sp. SCN 70-307 TaxID=1660089 RepID=UPI0025BBB54F|nr:MHYT domain-containing protein [Arenimonas sp. SCN 70-307]